MAVPASLVRSDLERELARILQQKVLDFFDKTEPSVVAETLGVSALAIDSWRATSEWSLDDALRIAVALDLVALDPVEPSDSPRVISINLR